jgi:hypothetical protein
VDPNDLRTFARRDWAAAESAKQQYWTDRFHRDGAAPARHAATLLLEHARRLGAVRPGHADRSDDFAHHVEIRDRLDRAARAFAGR